MNTIDELVSRGMTRIQHDSWNEGEYMTIAIVPSGSPNVPARHAPNAQKFTKGLPTETVPVYTLAGNGEPEWRPYMGPRSPDDRAP